MKTEPAQATNDRTTMIEQRAAGPLGYAAAILLIAKLVRAVELSVRLDTWQTWLTLPFSLGEDLIVLACVGFIALALARIPPRVGFGVAVWILLVPLALLLPADVISHKLTGAPLTWQRLRGDEGATLADLNLLELDDLIWGVGGIALSVALVALALRFLPRVSRLLRWARVRPLLGVLAVGVALHFAGEALDASSELTEQPVVALLASFIEPSTLTALTLSEPEWRALNRSAIKAKAITAPVLPDDRPHNVIIFLAEGIDYGHTGFSPRFNGKPLPRDKKGLPNPTPNLVRRHANHGFVFDRYYANWHASIQAIFSVACSQFPPMQGDIVRIKPRIDCGEFSEVMRSRGLAPGLFHGGLFSFYDKLALLGRRGYAIEQDAAELLQKSKRAPNQWGIDDRAIVEAALKWIDSLPKGKPFAALMIPITAHYPYWVPSDFKKPFKGHSREERFLSAVAFNDSVIEMLAKGLEKRGIYDDTLIAWLGDHGHYVGEPKRRTGGLRGSYEPNLHTPLVLLNRKLFPKTLASGARRNQRLGSHIDLVPTMLDALHLAQEPRHQGQSLLSQQFEPRRVFFGADSGRYVGFIDGNKKLTTSTRGKHVEYYDLAADPMELHDLAKEHREEVERLAKQAVRFARASEARIAAMPSLAEKLTVEQVDDLFVEHAAVSIRAADGSVKQCGAGANTRCEGLGAVMRIESGKVQGEMRRCVIVEVPPQDEILYEIRDPDTLALISGTRVAIPGALKDDPRFAITVTTDGVVGKTVYLSKSGTALPGHPRPRQSIQFAIRKRPSLIAPKRVIDAGAGDAAIAPPPPAPPGEVCLQLTGLFTK